MHHLPYKAQNQFWLSGTTVLRNYCFQILKINDSLPFSNESALLNGIIANSSNRLILNEYIESNLVLDSLLTRQKLEESLSLILPTRGVVAEGERIIAQGEVVDQKRFQILNSLRVEYLSDLWASSEQSIIIGYSILVSILIFLTFLFLWRYRPLVYENNTKVVFVFFHHLDHGRSNQIGDDLQY